MSYFTIAFIRFLISAVLELLIIIVYWVRISIKMRDLPSKPKPFQIIKGTVKKYYGAKNTKFMRGILQFGYLFWMGFLIVGVVVPFYYLSFELIGVVVSTIMVNAIPILIIALLNWMQKRDKLDAFKIIELFLLFCGIITIGLSYGSNSASTLPPLGLLVIFIAIIAFVVYSVGIGRDSQTGIPLVDQKLLSDSPSSFTEKLNHSIMGLNSFYKLFGIHFGGLIGNLVLVIALGAVDHVTMIGSQAREMLFYDFGRIGEYLFNPFLLAIAIICTLVPYMIQVIAVKQWPKFSLGFTSWNSILTVLQPLIGLYIGNFIWNEAIQLDYILFTTIFLLISIIIRYFHENANLKLILLRIRVDNLYLNSLSQYLRSLMEISELNITLGRVGIIAHANVQSLPRLFTIIQEIQAHPGVQSLEYYDEKIIKSE